MFGKKKVPPEHVHEGIFIPSKFRTSKIHKKKLLKRGEKLSLRGEEETQNTHRAHERETWNRKHTQRDINKICHKSQVVLSAQ